MMLTESRGEIKRATSLLYRIGKAFDRLTHFDSMDVLQKINMKGKY